MDALELLILGSNESLDRIEYDLHLTDSVEGYPFTVEWRTDEAYMDYTGKLVQDTLAAPVLMELTAVLSCENYEMERDMTVRIYSKAVQPGRAERLAGQIAGLEEESRTQQNMTLPSQSGDKSLRWSYKRSCKGIAVSGGDSGSCLFHLLQQGQRSTQTGCGQGRTDAHGLS